MPSLHRKESSGNFQHARRLMLPLPSLCHHSIVRSSSNNNASSARPFPSQSVTVTLFVCLPFRDSVRHSPCARVTNQRFLMAGLLRDAGCTSREATRMLDGKPKRLAQTTLAFAGIGIFCGVIACPSHSAHHQPLASRKTISSRPSALRSTMSSAFILSRHDHAMACKGNGSGCGCQANLTATTSMTARQLMNTHLRQKLPIAITRSPFAIFVNAFCRRAGCRRYNSCDDC